MLIDEHEQAGAREPNVVGWPLEAGDVMVPSFEAVSVVLPVIDETTSLEATVSELVATLGEDLGEIIIAVSPRTKPASRAVIDGLAELTGGRLRAAGKARDVAVEDPAGMVALVVHEQSLPSLGGAMREAFQLASCSHVVMMASDLETDPATVAVMVATSRQNPDAVVTATRWAGSSVGRFEGYDPLKLVLNRAFQRLFGVLYRTRLSDLTYGFRLFPTRLVQEIEWEELRHPFLFETILKPLRLGVPVVEVQTTWRARREGASSNTFLRNFEYLRTGLRIRFAPRRSMLRSNTPLAGRSDTPGIEAGPLPDGRLADGRLA